MRKTKGSAQFFLFTSRFLRCCLVIVTIGPIGLSTTDSAAQPYTPAKTVSPVLQRANSVLWGSNSQCVYFLDDDKKTTINKYDPGNQEFASAYFASPSNEMSSLVPVEASQSTFVACNHGELSVFTWDDENGIPITDSALPITLRPGESITCIKADSSQRLWIGTSYTNGESSADSLGRLYILSDNSSAINALDNIDVPQAIAWSPRSTRIYHISKAQIFGHRYGSAFGTITNSDDSVFNFTSCQPNDITVDASGKLWVACFATANVLKIEPTNGTVLKELKFPKTGGITSIAFGGLNLENLYVTASGVGLFEVTDTGSTGIEANSINLNSYH